MDGMPCARKGKTLSTIENPKVLTLFSVGTLGFSIVLSVGGGKKINPTIYIYVRKGAAKFTRQGLRRKTKNRQHPTSTACSKSFCPF